MFQPSDEKADVDVEGVETTDAAPTTESNHSREEIPDTADQQADTVKKCRKRRKPNTETLTETDQKEASESVAEEPSAFTGVTAETTETKQNNDEISDVSGTAASSPEHKMTELTVEIPEDNHAVKTMPTSPEVPVIDEATDSREQEKSSENPIVSCSTSLPVSSQTDAPSSTTKTLHSPPVVSPKRISPVNTSAPTAEERKIDQKNSQLEKKSTMSKSSHFDFLANSIIITDVTTERGTVTVKECSAYGDFFEGSK